jgi:hypothetical protein
VPLTVLAACGVVVAGVRRHWGLLFWAAIGAASLLVNPLPWQRYALPFLPAATMLAALGLLVVGRWTAHNLRDSARELRARR